MNLNIMSVILLLMALLCSPCHAEAKSSNDSLLNKTFRYHNSIIRCEEDTSLTVYVRQNIDIDKRNVTLMVIPSMYSIARGNKQYIGETYSKIKIVDYDKFDSSIQVNTGTVPRNRKAMEFMQTFLVPTIYGNYLFGGYLISPFSEPNKRLYKYSITEITPDRSEIIFKPRLINTQLVSGTAVVRNEDGRIIRVTLEGEYDMIKFNVNIIMGDGCGLKSLYPAMCSISSDFKFLGNKLSSDFFSVYDLPIELSSDISNSHDRTLMGLIRPDSLTSEEEQLYITHDSVARERKATKEKENSTDSPIEEIGDYLIERIKGNFGDDDQGSYRISPILNPLYLSYSHNKGITYKMKVRGNYNFTNNSSISLYLKASYSFKQKQLYYRMPIRLSYNKKKNGYLELEIGNGNRISNSEISEQVKNETLDSIDWSKMNLDYFKDFYVKLYNNVDLGKQWTIQPGFIFHRRTAVDKTGFVLAQKPYKYISFAPAIRLQLRPWQSKGPVFTADYERAIKGVGESNMDYERIELDASWHKPLYSLRSLSLRLSGGFYTSRDKDAYFLDYRNFREENIPGGWDDDWTGEFQLLNSNWYNASQYYVSTNATYESPLMIMAHLPLVGRYIETERIYVNSLFVEHLHPYMEWGYGFTNRIFSMGIFVATKNASFEGVGCRFGFELFRDW